LSLTLRLLHGLPPEAAHRLTIAALRLGLAGAASDPPDPILQSRLWGRSFANPIGIAAGFDKHAEAIGPLLRLGFGCVEIGSVTPRAQAGNPRPRLFRLAADQAVINRMGFNNRGADHVAERVAAANFRGVRGVSIGKNADTPLERAVDDYLDCLRKLYAVADYFAINVSSPNTRGLRALQSRDALAGIVEPLQEERERLAARHGKRVPLLVKISPDLDQDGLRDMAAALRSHALDGVIATNTSTSIAGYETELARSQGGGISGTPLRDKALSAARLLRQELGNAMPIIGVGGLMSADDVNARLAAGANLVQLYTGFVYRGPALLADILQRLNPPPRR